MTEVFNEFLVNESLIEWIKKVSLNVKDVKYEKMADNLEKLLSLILYGIQLPTIVIYQSNPISIIGNADMIYILNMFYTNKIKFQYHKFDGDIISSYRINNDMYYSELPDEIKWRFNYAKISVLKIYKCKNEFNNSIERLIKELYQ